MGFGSLALILARLYQTRRDSLSVMLAGSATEFCDILFQSQFRRQLFGLCDRAGAAGVFLQRQGKDE